MNFSGMPTPPNLDWYFVVKPLDNSSTRYLIRPGTTNGNDEHLFTATGSTHNVQYLSRPLFTSYNYNINLSVTQKNLCRMVVQPSAGNWFPRASLNGGTLSGIQGRINTNTAFGEFGNQSFYNGSAVWNSPFGEVSEVIVFPSTLVDSNRFQVEGYLAWKWGIESLLPSNHIYKNAPP
jgi:hypothetical protein